MTARGYRKEGQLSRKYASYLVDVLVRQTSLPREVELHKRDENECLKPWGVFTRIFKYFQLQWSG